MINLEVNTGWLDVAETVVRLTEISARTACLHLLNGVVAAHGQDGRVAALLPPAVSRLGVSRWVSMTDQSHRAPGHCYRLLGQYGGLARLVADIDNHRGVLLSPLPLAAGWLDEIVRVAEILPAVLRSGLTDMQGLAGLDKLWVILPQPLYGEWPGVGGHLAVDGDGAAEINITGPGHQELKHNVKV